MRRARERQAGRRGAGAAARQGHAAHAAPDVREPRARCRPRPALGYGPARPHRSAPHAERLRPGDAAPARRRGADLAADAISRRARRADVWPNEWPNERLGAVRRDAREPTLIRERPANAGLWARRVSNLRPLACEAWRSSPIRPPKYLQIEQIRQAANVPRRA